MVTFPQARHLLSSQGSMRDKRPLGLCCVRLFRAFLTPGLSTQRLKPAPRHNGGRFPRMASELRVPDLDLGPTDNKLGVLWTWDRNERSRRPIYTVLAAGEVRETAAMMPHWEPSSCCWSIYRRVFKNRFLMDPRTRPPFPKRCKCLDPEPGQSGSADTTD